MAETRVNKTDKLIDTTSSESAARLAAAQAYSPHNVLHVAASPDGHRWHCYAHDRGAKCKWCGTQGDVSGRRDRFEPVIDDGDHRVWLKESIV